MIATDMIGDAVDPADWVTIWQSELAALAVDRECAEALLLWGQPWVSAGDQPPGRPGPDAAAGAAPLGAAYDLERELARFREQLAGLAGLAGIGG